ncbi:hypothetical protein Y1Q_0006278 [Alligator mississippiensis]|uniref:Uncharacterized protein n=1 Tax=Alligator mississippiensis TaxID=8496 RepID=A0A151NXU8_ALLMI|nr:hypothetical protein Y1Q_0006278 [Alligator mississippiensis]
MGLQGQRGAFQSQDGDQGVGHLSRSGATHVTLNSSPKLGTEAFQHLPLLLASCYILAGTPFFLYHRCRNY